MSGSSIDLMMVSNCGAHTHGLNRLPSGYSIPGGSHAFTVPAGWWDVGAGEVLSRNSWTEGYARVTVMPGRTTMVPSRQRR